MRRHFKASFRIILASLALSGCAHESIKDHPAFGDEGKFGAVEVHTLFTQIAPKHIDKPTWDAMRIGMVCFNGNDINDMQHVIDDLCTKYSGCDYDAYQGVKAALKTMSQHMRDHADRFR